MAIGSPPQKWTVLQNSNLDIGGCTNTGLVAIDFSGIVGTISITVQSRVAGTAAGVSENGFDCWYLNAETYAKVAAGTAVSSASRILVPCAGATISLFFEAFAGSDAVVVQVQQLDGPLPTSWTA